MSRNGSASTRGHGRTRTDEGISPRVGLSTNKCTNTVRPADPFAAALAPSLPTGAGEDGALSPKTPDSRALTAAPSSHSGGIARVRCWAWSQCPLSTHSGPRRGRLQRKPIVSPKRGVDIARAASSLGKGDPFSEGLGASEVPREILAHAEWPSRVLAVGRLHPGRYLWLPLCPSYGHPGRCEPDLVADGVLAAPSRHRQKRVASSHSACSKQPTASVGLHTRRRRIFRRTAQQGRWPHCLRDNLVHGGGVG